MIDLIHIAQAAETAESSGVIGTLGINWKFLLAQLVNFAIILFVMWKWVLPPVAKKLTERAERLTLALQDAKNIEVQKKEFEKWEKVAMAKARSEAADIVAKAKGEAETVRTELLAKTKQEQEKIFAEGQEKLVQEQTKMLQEAKGQLAGLVVAATEKILGEKMTDKQDAELAKKALVAVK